MAEIFTHNGQDIQVAYAVSDQNGKVIDTNYATKEELSTQVDTLNSTISEINSSLTSSINSISENLSANYYTSAEVDTILEDYTTLDNLNTTLTSYATTESVNTLLEDYWNTTTNSIILDYVEKVSYVDDTNYSYFTFTNANTTSSSSNVSYYFSKLQVNSSVVSLVSTATPSLVDLDSVYANKTEVDSSLSTINTSISSLETNVSSLSTNIESVSSNVDSLTTNLEDNYYTKNNVELLGLPKLQPIVQRAYNQATISDNQLDQGYMTSTSKVVYFNASKFSFRLAYDLTDTSNIFIGLFQAKKKCGNYAGRKFTHRRSVNSRYSNNLNFWSGMTEWGATNTFQESALQSLLDSSSIKTEWYLDDTNDCVEVSQGVYQLQGYIVLVLEHLYSNNVGRVPLVYNNSDTGLTFNSSTEYRVPNFAFALCKYEDGMVRPIISTFTVFEFRAHGIKEATSGNTCQFNVNQLY